MFEKCFLSCLTYLQCFKNLIRLFFLKLYTQQSISNNVNISSWFVDFDIIILGIYILFAIHTILHSWFSWCFWVLHFRINWKKKLHIIFFSHCCTHILLLLPPSKRILPPYLIFAKFSLLTKNPALAKKYYELYNVWYHSSSFGNLWYAFS